ncbi:TPA: hypothetical protein EYP26_04000 [Candidatus Bathyarchaeota archaeon]|nr:hypothetical protein [Candidatus Bathyarchaeota archaeon]
MALIVRKIVSREYGAPPADASRFYIMVESFYLSEAYELATGDKVRGEILKVKLGGEEFPALKGKAVELIYKEGAAFDRLYISKKDWEEH